MSDNFRPPPRPKNIFDHPKMKLYAPCPTPEGKGKTSSLGWQVVDSNPRMVVYTNCPNDTGEQNEYGKITAAMDPLMFFSLIQLLDQVIKMPTPTETPIRFQVPNLKAGWDRQKNKPGDPYEISTTWVGKDVDGTIWISVRHKTKKERPVIKFPFTIPRFHDLRNADGSAWTEGQKSELAAKGYIDMMGRIMGTFLPPAYKEPEPKDDKGGGRGGYGGGGGGGNRGGGYGGGNSDNANAGGGGGGGNRNMQDDDIPF